MSVKTGGNVFVENIKLNDILYEFEHGMCIKTKVISLPKLNKKDKAWTWKGESLVDGRTIKYLVDPKYPQYAPKVYDYEAYEGCKMI